MGFRKSKLTRRVKDASMETLGDMLIDNEITSEVYKNEILRRKFEAGYFMKKKYKSLVKDEMRYGIYHE
jgi:hypothetical protein